MLWLVPFLMTVAAGWFLARMLTAAAFTGPRWTGVLAELGLCVLLGPGLASILYFAMAAIQVANRGSVLAMLALLLAGSGAAWWKLTPHTKPATTRKSFSWNWVLWIGVALGLVFFAMDFHDASSANPAGEWDAMSIWNLRARYLASGGDLWHRAVSSDLGGHAVGAAHPGYPLFLSGFIGTQWMVEGSFDESASIATSFLFAFAGLLLLGSSLAARKSVALGLLAWLVLFASEVYASQAAVEYSDLLQGLAFLSALVLLEAAAAGAGAEPRLLLAAGLAIGLSCWIKNEGLPFALAALGVGLWRFRQRGAACLVAGALPGFLALASLKLVAQGREEMFPHTLGEAVDKIASAGRWWQAALGFLKAVWDAGNWWSHPVLLVALIALAVRLAPRSERIAGLWLAVPVAAAAAAEYGLYLITTANLDWHISTSVSRLVAQLWPSLIWLSFMALRAPEEAFMPAEAAGRVTAAPAGSGEAKRKRKAAKAGKASAGK